MSFPTTNEPPVDAPVPVFVDESGRRRARTRFLARTIVAGAGIYALVVIAGLTGSVSLPGVHLGELARVAPGRARSSPLGPASKVVSLPAALKPGPSTVGAAPSETTSGGSGGAQGTAGPQSGAAGGATAGPTTTQGPTTTSHRATTTTNPSPSTTTSTLPVTTTTKHGPRTSTSHGPPSTTPGQGTGRSNL
jgi:hypothetical protein